MKSNNILIGGLIGGVTSFLLGWIIYGVLLKDAMTSPVSGLMKPETDMVWWAMIGSCLAQGFLLSYIFGRWANITTAVGGASAGATLGILMALYYDLGFYAMSNMFTMQTMLMDIVMSGVMMGAVGAVVGWWLGRSKE